MALVSFRFRNKARDIATDVDRIRPLRRAVSDALQAAEEESRGLRERLQEARTSAAFLFGDEIESEAGAADRRELARAEALLSRGEIRMRYLERQITALGEVGRLLDGIEAPVTAAPDISAPK